MGICIELVLLLASVVFEVSNEVMLTGVPVGVVNTSGVVSMLSLAVELVAVALVSVVAVFPEREVGPEEVTFTSVGFESVEMVV